MPKSLYAGMDLSLQDVQVILVSSSLLATA